MRKMQKNTLVIVLISTVVLRLYGDSLTLKPIKDNFARSNKRIRNSGGSERLMIAHSADFMRSWMSFDLQGITNEITSATLRIHLHNTLPDAISLRVAAMVPEPSNEAWREGVGNLGAQGQNARVGESNWACSAFPEVGWKNALGQQLDGLSDPSLWQPVCANVAPLRWTSGQWVRIPLTNCAEFEKRRSSELPFMTLGIWGTSGSGVYAISSRHSAWSPELILTVKKNEE